MIRRQSTAVFQATLGIDDHLLKGIRQICGLLRCLARIMRNQIPQIDQVQALTVIHCFAEFTGILTQVGQLRERVFAEI